MFQSKLGTRALEEVSAGIVKVRLFFPCGAGVELFYNWLVLRYKEVT